MQSNDYNVDDYGPEDYGLREIDYSKIDNELKDLVFGLPRLRNHMFKNLSNLENHVDWLNITKQYSYHNAVIELSNNHISESITFLLNEIENLSVILNGKIERYMPDNPTIKIEKNDDSATWSIPFIIGKFLNDIAILTFQITKKAKDKNIEEVLNKFNNLKNKYLNIVLKGNNDFLNNKDEDEEDSDLEDENEIKEFLESLPNLGMVERCGKEELDYSKIDIELKDLLFGLPRLTVYEFITRSVLKSYSEWLKITKKYYYYNAVIALSENNIVQAITHAQKEMENINEILNLKIEQKTPANPLIKIKQGDNEVMWSIPHMIGSALNEIAILIFQIKMQSKDQNIDELLSNFNILKNKYFDIILNLGE